MILECLAIQQQAGIAQGKCPDCDGQLVEGLRESGATIAGCQSCGAIFWVGYRRQPKRVRQV